MRGDGQNQLKISAPHPMTKTYRLIPLLAALISLESLFNLPISANFRCINLSQELPCRNRTVFRFILLSLVVFVIKKITCHRHR
jgi:hypothetical protein